MKCEKCGKSHDGTYGSGRYCNRGCSNSRTHTKETLQKISKGVKTHISKNGHQGGCNKDLMTVDEYENYLFNLNQTLNLKLLEKDFSEVNEHSIKKRVYLEQKGSCNNCGLTEWLGTPIVLELEHKDGNHQNNIRENLECLCPNCHSLTDTWRGRNKKGKRSEKVTDKEICIAYLKEGNIRQALLSLDMAAKGSNYGRVKRALTLNQIPY